MFEIEHLIPAAIENFPFTIDRPEGSFRHIFFHFISPVTIEIDDKKIECNPGTVILYTPGTRQKFYVERNRLNHDYIDFTIDDPDFFKNVNFPLNTPLTPKMSNFISQIVNEIAAERKNGGFGSSYLIDAKMIELFVGIVRKIHRPSSQSTVRYNEELKTRFENTRLAMYQNPDFVSVSSLAKSLGFSLPRFNELYKTYFQTTPIKDLTKARVSRVKDLLESGASTKEIILKIGFSSEEYFYRWFKKNFGMTKEQYLKSLRGDE